MTKKILFISHDDSRTGAPILLINLKNAIVQFNPHFQVDFLIKNCHYIMYNIFNENGTTYVINDFRKKSLIERVMNKFIPNYQLKNRLKKLKKINISSYDLILSNTITNGDILPLVRKLYSGIIVSYIHELKMSSILYSNKRDIQELIGCTDFFAFPSEAVKQHLIKEHNVNSDLLRYLPYFIEIPDRLDISLNKKRENYLLIGACGTADWRKGFDLFIQVALYFTEVNPQIKTKFIWKGSTDGWEVERAKYDIIRSGLADIVELRNSGDDMKEFWNSIDLFLLTSREDPFPLVVLEAAANKVPIIGFKDSGGAPEFLSNDAGIIIPYMSVMQMSNAISSLMDNPLLYKKIQNNAFEKMGKTYSNELLITDYFQKIMNLENNDKSKN